MKATQSSIDAFLANKQIAVAGVSRDQKKFGYQVFKLLADRGFDVYPVNPGTDAIAGIPCFRSVQSLPSGVNSLVIVTRKEQTRDVVADAMARDIRHLWIQQMSDTPEALELARAGDMNLITGECIMMHANPVKGIHKFHRAILKLFGRLPR